MVLRAQINTLQEWETKQRPKWLSGKKSIKPLSTKLEKHCFNCGKHWPHQGGQRKCPAFGKQCTRSGKRNHFAKCCKNKQEIKLAQGGEQITDTSSDSSDEDSMCTLQEVNPVGQSDNRPLKTVLISGIDITVLPDSGATVNAMDEATFKKYGLEKRVKIRKSRCQIKPYGAA